MGFAAPVLWFLAGFLRPPAFCATATARLRPVLLIMVSIIQRLSL
jgi:hypothetical protein